MMNSYRTKYRLTKPHSPDIWTGTLNVIQTEINHNHEISYFKGSFALVYKYYNFTSTTT